MNLNLKHVSLADLPLKIFSEMETNLEAQFLELLQLRELVRQAEQARARGLRRLLSLQSPSACR